MLLGLFCSIIFIIFLFFSLLFYFHFHFSVFVFVYFSTNYLLFIIIPCVCRWCTAGWGKSLSFSKVAVFCSAVLSPRRCSSGKQSVYEKVCAEHLRSDRPSVHFICLLKLLDRCLIQRHYFLFVVIAHGSKKS